ncbi:glycosyl transferase family 2 [Roseibium sp. TrichSKD4]|uniref:glycosyltransferase family 2 protein n=1 Tax=Roseibium sp. TrichSKD4 TaxID=744980 RepID=UPI0001E566C3|nr:glycosyltransferase family 2 protein [Roseibium sp. TrichSKD4]EFO34318.1 glycosyl transferase family 2 [Roseibium sp. TrichSKD4]
MTGVADLFDVLVARGISKSLMVSALRYAPKEGIAASEYLVRNRLLTEETIYSAFAELCSVPFLPEGSFRVSTVKDQPVHLGSEECGPMLVGVHEGKAVYVLSPSHAGFEEVRDHLQKHPEMRAQVRIASPAAIRLATKVTNSPAADLEHRYPHLSAKKTRTRPRIGWFLTGAFLMLAFLTLPSSVWFWRFMMMMAIACCLTGFARLASTLATWDNPLDYRLPNRLQETAIIWPAYTVLVPLYREANVVIGLVQALQDMDYPTDRLQVLYLIESDDRETLAALRACRSPNHMEILVVPDGSPRTKPRALSYGLAEATGDYVTVYDAEDRPQPDQLKKAAYSFGKLPQNFACLQARLSIDNANDGFLSRHFALEYACLFDQLLPWLFRIGIPFPLGGTSNHFRKRALEQVGGWDRFNVTEDADLGVRLARFGYQLGVMTSSTYEEAPITLRAWLAQRARWYKGWLQTIGVHMRQPQALIEDIGFRNWLALSALFAGSLALIALHPVFFSLLFAYAFGFVEPPAREGGLEQLLLALSITGSAIGYAGAAIAVWKAGDKRHHGPRLADLLTLPIYWFCTGIALYRAVWELFKTPYVWNKTTHGQARTRMAVKLPEAAE